ncbi:phosphotransferase enzyme family [Fusarium tjaetaba]|uniref:Phosphotransferase enzyme family n=1 Tax=Fusarium tjaetaba TaxID=1567544 RepID=A0A8H5VB82_9HYPO|nr:phosphotransferase enzyme family [Fusarium tjaetaba]KAF5615665.1 phosphotransferase enzyme family [Fusarium tjaetaba]
MLTVIYRFILAQFASLISPIFALYRLLVPTQVEYGINSPPTQDQHDKNANKSNDDRQQAAGVRVDDNVMRGFPPTEQQLEARIKGFIDSIDKDAVCRLASRHNSHKSCRVVGHDRGSFNVCFFVLFDAENVTWVVRIPLEPVVCDAWAKVQSEVATMRYVEHNTTVPIPRVYTYGRAPDLLVQDGSATVAFLICDYISGQSLSLKALAGATEDRRKHLYHDLIDILSQLYKLEFSVAGSLMPNPAGGPDPVIGPILSMSANELYRCCQQQGGLEPPSSEGQYLAYQSHILSETYRLPTQDLSSDQVRMELFALESLTKHAFGSLEFPESTTPFSMAHQDLRCSNIIVTQDLHVSGIIDWEFAGTIPRYLSTPPPWLSGDDLDAVSAFPAAADITLKEVYAEFIEVLEVKSATSSDCAKLMDPSSCVS